MKKIFYTLIYGNRRTKLMLLLMITGFILGFSVFVYALIVKNYIAVVSALVLLVADIILVLGTDFNTLLLNTEKSKSKQKSSKKANKSKDLSADENVPESNNDLPDLNTNDFQNRKKPNDFEKNDPEPKKNIFEEDEVNPLTLYDKNSLKKLFVKYKVKQEHTLILIDECKKEKIYECPGILWKDKVYAYILLLEKEPRMVKFNFYDYNELHIRVEVPADPEREYKQFKEKTLLGEMYKSYLPNYTILNPKDKFARKYKKNLYGIGPDIFCTSSSVKNIMKILSLNLVLTESNIQKRSYSDWFKRIYISRLMYRDKVFEPEEYKNQVLALLNEMAETADNEDFALSLSQLLNGSLIPQEYADYANYKRKNK